MSNAYIAIFLFNLCMLGHFANIEYWKCGGIASLEALLPVMRVIAMAVFDMRQSGIVERDFWLTSLCAGSTVERQTGLIKVKNAPHTLFGAFSST
jgi:hypothetical protein